MMCYRYQMHFRSTEPDFQDGIWKYVTSVYHEQALCITFATSMEDMLNVGVQSL